MGRVTLAMRCAVVVYSYVNYPDPQMELAILNARHPDLNAHLASQIIGFVQKLREENWKRSPALQKCWILPRPCRGWALRI